MLAGGKSLDNLTTSVVDTFLMRKLAQPYVGEFLVATLIGYLELLWKYEPNSFIVSLLTFCSV